MEEVLEIFNRVNWENKPSLNTALSAGNLNKSDAALKTIDTRVVTLYRTKLDKTTAYEMVKNVTYDESTGIFTVEYLNGTTATLDTKLEKLAVNFEYDRETEKLIITNSDGTTEEVDLSALITEYEFENSSTVGFTIENGKVKAAIPDGAINGDKLEPNYLSNCVTAKTTAEAKALAAEGYSSGTQNSIPVGPDSPYYENNAKYYKEAAQAIVGIGIATTETAGIVKPDGSTLSIQSDGTISAEVITYGEAALTDNESELASGTMYCQVAGGSIIKSWIGIDGIAKALATGGEPEPTPTEVTFLVEGAKEDSISITKDGESVGTVIFGSGETSKEVTLTVEEGEQYTFTSSVAKSIDGSGGNYSKVVSLSADTTSVSVMPSGALYWYGNECESFNEYYRNGSGTATYEKLTNEIYFNTKGKDTYRALCSSNFSVADCSKVSTRLKLDSGSSTIRLLSACTDQYPSSSSPYASLTSGAYVMQTTADNTVHILSADIDDTSADRHMSITLWDTASATQAYGHFYSIWLDKPRSIVGEDVTLTLIGAKEDKITIYDTNGDVVQRVTFDSGTTQKNVTLTIMSGGEDLTFVSSVAKDTTSGTSNYSKTVSVDTSTTSVKVMPEKSLYWYGNECTDLTGGWTTDGYQFSSGWTGSVTKENSYITLSSTNQYSIVGTTNKVNMDNVSKAYININVVSLGSASENWFTFGYAPDEKTGSPNGLTKKTDLTTGNHILNFDATSGNHYIETYMRGGGYSFNYRVIRVWLE